MPKARRSVIGQRDATGFLVALSSPVDTSTLGVVVEAGKIAGSVLPVQSILARGGWENYTGTAKEEAAILALVPADGQLHFAAI